MNDDELVGRFHEIEPKTPPVIIWGEHRPGVIRGWDLIEDEDQMTMAERVTEWLDVFSMLVTGLGRFVWAVFYLLLPLALTVGITVGLVMLMQWGHR